MIRLRGIQQQQGVTGRRGVEHNKGVFALGHRAGKRAEHGDFLGARRTQIFLQQCAAIGVEIFAGGRQHMLDVVPRLRLRVNPADLHPGDLSRCRRNVCCRVGGAQMNFETAPRQFGCNGGGDGGFANAAFAHRHNDATLG